MTALFYKNKSTAMLQREILSIWLQFHDSNLQNEINLFHATSLFLYILKHRKNPDFLMFSGGVKRDHWHV